MEIGYYPGCSLHSNSKEYDSSIKAVLERLNIALSEIKDWNCCGATPAHSVGKELGVALPYSNILNASDQGQKSILAPCAACYNRLRVSQHEVETNPSVKSSLEGIFGREVETDLKVMNILEFLRDLVGLQKIKDAVTHELKGLKVAAYYGCLLLRPHDILGFDDEECPESMEEIIKATGADPVNWTHRTECCGGSLAVPETDIALSLSEKIFKSAKKAGAEAIIVGCPLCHLNLDMRLSGINKKFNTDYSIPVLYITELIGLSFGISINKLGIDKHFVSADLLKNRLNLK